ncbi:TonB-dependent receptor [Gemmatimonas aurantiaca]|uniref:TonB-dependent receptor n=1 Tax=Gemmatimonas aurantiaca TaxID=173480 RepID=UPI00059BE3FB|nr:TonB-dependent receptor [Gemmatimonas aurantiaca]
MSKSATGMQDGAGHLHFVTSAPSDVYRRLYGLCATLLVLLGCLATPASAQQVDVIRGRITGADNEPLENVTVIVTTISGNVNRTARTDRSGRYTVTFPNGDGDYMVTVNAVGFAQKRFEIKRVADEDVLLGDAKLSKVGTVLDAMKVTADRQKVSRNDVSQDISGTERVIPANNAALPPDQMGDLAAMAATLPGVQLVPGQDGGANGYSVMGMGADQNNTTLNGMNFGGSGLPRDAQVGSSLSTSPYDVSRGGFSGGQFSLSTRSGSNFSARGLSFLGEAPQLQWMDAPARATGQQYSNGSIGGSVAGPLVFDKAFYMMAFQLGRRSNDLQTLLNTSTVGLQATGIAADSVQRLVGILGASNVPTSANGLPNSRLADQGSVVGSIDFAPPSSTSGTAYNLTFNGAWNRQNPATPLTSSLPTASAQRTGLNAGLQGRHSAYLAVRGINLLTETSVGLNASQNEGSPFVNLPAGRVRVNSAFGDGSTGVQMLAFGGNQTLATTQSSNSVMANNSLSWFSANNKHRLKLASEFRRDGSSQDQTLNRLGTFTYNSLADLQAGIPVSFTRTLSPRERDASQLIGALSLGDSYRRTNRLQFQYGVRVDANKFLDAPAVNSAVEQRFGVRNTEVPNGIYPSVRGGFSWQYGTGPQIGAFEGAFRGPRAVVRGGIGMFQNMPQATLIGSAIDNTGLANAIQQLACVGPATPVPAWSTYANPGNIPTRCADGTTGTVFANGAPNVTLFAKNFAPSTSIRSNLSWSGAVLRNRMNGSFDATYSINQRQSSFVDRNFAGVERFVIDNEDGRPVYVRPTSIVPLTGGIAAGDGRLDSTFQRVTEQRSDLTSRSAQFTARFSPMTFNSTISWNASYTYSNVREQFRGFSSTAGDPNAISWSRSPFDSRHQITYNVTWNAFDFIRISWGGQFRSGSPFTPSIGGDVNGDGFSNDRAFIFDPSTSGDATTAAAMQALLDKGSDVARRCLSKQLGTLAGRNSCEGPWISTANLSFSFNPLKVRMPQRATLSFNVSNPLGAADLLMNGADNLKGWGQQVFVDPALLYVRGFDPVTKRYKYEVNQRFGATNPQFQQFRAPVTVSAMLCYDIGATRERQVLTQTLDRGRRTQGTKAQEAVIKAQFGTGGVPNPLATILRDQDTLKLSSTQADSLAMMNRRYTVRLDSIWAPIAKRYAELPSGYSRDRVYWEYVKAREASIDILRGYAPAVRALLTDAQKRRLPAFITTSLDDRYLRSIRSGTAGGGGPMMLPGGATFMGAGAMGGGAQTTIIMR